MNKFSNRSVANLSLCLVIIAFFGAGCGMIKNPFRDYSEKPFNSPDWLKGDEVERGRMYIDLLKSRSLGGKTRDEVKNLLGEPDKKETVEGKEVWLYRVEQSIQTPLKYFPVSFDEKGASFAGRVKGGTISILVEN